MSIHDEIEKSLTSKDGWMPQDYSVLHKCTSRRIIIAADMHIPKHDVDFSSKMIEYAVSKNIDTIIYLGDMLDLEEFSAYGIEDPTSTFKRNCRLAGAFIQTVRQYIPYAIWSSGNHEDRINRVTKGQYDLETIALTCGLQTMIDTGTLIVSQNPSIECTVGNWLVIHPKAYGSPLVSARRIANRYQKNTILAHEHSLALGREETDRFWACNVGGLFDARYHHYYQRQITGNRSWCNGFATLIDGKINLLSKSDFYE